MISFRRHILPNGLRIIHHYDGSTKMTALNLLYDVGSKDESPERTGFAHLFEHLMFGGSVNIPDFDTPLQKAGGENNAWTSNDVTNYYTVVPTHNAETAFWLESDRMLSLAFSSESLSVQKQVVIEEFKQRNLNQPYGDSFLLLRPMAYRVHPYRWPVIGKNTSHIGNASLEEVKEFFFAHYAPNNAILSISGSLPFDEAILLCEKWFAPISRREVACRDLPQEPVQTKPHKKIVEREVPLDAIFKAYHMVDRKHPDYQGYDALSDVLASGRSSRLYRRLVMEKKLFTEIDSSITGDIEPGLFLLKGKLSPGISLEQGEEYGRNLEENLEALIESLKKKSYKPKPARLVEIPKDNGKMRPLSIYCYEDKLVSGSGNVAQYTVEKLIQLGAKVVTMSDSDGYIYDPDGIDREKLDYIMELKNLYRGRIREYAEKYGCKYVAGARPWNEKADIALPSATQNEINGDDAKALVANGVFAVSEGANMPSTPEAIHVFQDAKILYAPGKAANAGGVSVSGLEMTQNSIKLSWSQEEVDEKLKSIMKNIHEACVKYGTEPDGYINYVKGANVAGFMKVANAMMAQGIV